MHTYELETQIPPGKRAAMKLGAWEGTIKTHRKILASLESNLMLSKLSTNESQPHSNILWNYDKLKLGFVTYHSLHAVSPLTSVCNLTG